MKSNRARLNFFAAAALVASTWAPLARGESMPHFDLTGLALESQAVVVASRVSSRTAGTYQRFETFRVERSLSGSLAAGTVIELDTSLYVMSPLPNGAQRDPTTALFLQANRGDPQHPWSIVMSGLRVSASGLAYRVVQMNNPGLYQLAPQVSDDRTSIARSSAAPAVPWAQFVTAAERAIARASRIRVLENSPATASRTELIDLLGPRMNPASIVLRDGAWLGLFRDAASERIARIFEARRDVTGALEAGFRYADGPFDYRPSALTAADLWPTIESASAAPEHRATAIRAVTAYVLLDAPLATRLAALLASPEPLVRQAAADVLERGRGGFSSDPGDARRRRAVAAIIDRAFAEYVRRETDPLVRYWLIERSSSTPNALGANVPTEALFALAERKRLTVALGARGAALPTISRVEMQLVAANAQPIACGPQTATWASSSSVTSRWNADLRCPSAVDGTEYAARFTITLSTRRGSTTRTVDQRLRW